MGGAPTGDVRSANAGSDGGAAGARYANVVQALANPDFLAGRDGNEIVWKDGTRMPFDDGRSGMRFSTRLDTPSLKDLFYTPYRLGTAGLPADADIDPGRMRYQPFFLEMYGDCRKGETARTTIDGVWLPRKRATGQGNAR